MSVRLSVDDLLLKEMRRRDDIDVACFCMAFDAGMSTRTLLALFGLRSWSRRALSICRGER